MAGRILHVVADRHYAGVFLNSCTRNQVFEMWSAAFKTSMVKPVQIQLLLTGLFSSHPDDVGRRIGLLKRSVSESIVGGQPHQSRVSFAGDNVAAPV